MRSALATAALLLAGISALASQAQTGSSLGEAAEKARQEREARKDKKAATSYGEANLPNPALAFPTLSEDEAPAPAGSAAAPLARGKKEKTDDEIRAEKKAGFEKRIAEQVSHMDLVRKLMDEAQTELNDATAITTYGTRRTTLQQRLEDGQAELKKAQQAIADTEEEARRLGIAVSRP